MTTITIMESANDVLQVPKSLLKLLGWQSGSKIEALADDKRLVLTTPEAFILSAEDEAILDKGFGMFKITKENAPSGSLFDFDVADHVTLFDEED